MVNIASILVPLYIYPSSSSWNPLYTAIEANPSVQFNVVVNPNSGPGSSSYPDSNYISGISKLNSYSQVTTLGYVHTSYAARSASDVEADITVYAGWSNYTSSDIHVDGIFFDEATSDTSQYSYMQTISDFARSSLSQYSAYTVFNPGTIVDSSFFDLADSIVMFENKYKSWSSSVQNQIASENPAKSSVLINHFSGSLTDQQNIVNNISSAGIGSVFITSQASYNSFSQYWSQFVADVASPQQVSAASSSSSAPAVTTTDVASSTTPASTTLATIASSTTDSVPTTSSNGGDQQAQPQDQAQPPTQDTKNQPKSKNSHRRSISERAEQEYERNFKMVARAFVA